MAQSVATLQVSQRRDIEYSHLLKTRSDPIMQVYISAIDAVQGFS